MSDFSVEVADLKGWAEQVGRAGTDLYTAHEYAKKHITDGNFGKILDLCTEEYTKLLPSVRDTVLADSEGQDKARLALTYAAEEYKRVDRNFASELAKLDDTPLIVTDDGVADGFNDRTTGASLLIAPTVDSRALAQITLGIPYDQICWLLVKAGIKDPRDLVTNYLSGDIGKAGTQVSAWRNLAKCTEAARGNLEDGRKMIAKTWSGKAATSANGQFEKWNTALGNQKTAMETMANHLADAVDAAIKMAQVLVDIFMTVVELVGLALSNATVPVVGQIKLIRTVKAAGQMIWESFEVITTFVQLVTTIKSAIVGFVAVFTQQSLPTPATS
ncbi:WXG100 family type VII secretion target [Nocardia sp. NPDC057440]|uniref:WXG100 family type VII secretion target n=1 Tax=Nocardia sp. NPDC057440 TaxID=3346134 RepID=UPI003672E7D0